MRIKQFSASTSKARNSKKEITVTKAASINKPNSNNTSILAICAQTDSTHTDRKHPNIDLSDQKGTTMIHLTLVLPILFMFTFGIIDLGRYFTVLAILNNGAENGLNVAIKVPWFDVDVRGIDTASSDFQNFKAAREKAIRASVDVPLKTLLTNFDQQGDSILRAVKLDDMVALGDSTEYGAAVLRPGECATLRSNEKICNQDFLPAYLNASTNPNTTPDYLMMRYPVRVVLEADMKPILPFLGSNLRVRGIATGYREQIPRSGSFLVPNSVTPQPSPVPTASPTASPTPDLGLPSPSPSPSPSPTSCSSDVIINCKIIQWNLNYEDCACNPPSTF